jgi:hypothetical protein
MWRPPESQIDPDSSPASSESGPDLVALHSAVSGLYDKLTDLLEREESGEGWEIRGPELAQLRIDGRSIIQQAMSPDCPAPVRDVAQSIDSDWNMHFGDPLTDEKHVHTEGLDDLQHNLRTLVEKLGPAPGHPLGALRRGLKRGRKAFEATMAAAETTKDFLWPPEGATLRMTRRTALGIGIGGFATWIGWSALTTSEQEKHEEMVDAAVEQYLESLPEGPERDNARKKFRKYYRGDVRMFYSPDQFDRLSDAEVQTIVSEYNQYSGDYIMPSEEDGTNDNDSEPSRSKTQIPEKRTFVRKLSTMPLTALTGTGAKMVTQIIALMVERGAPSGDVAQMRAVEERLRNWGYGASTVEGAVDLALLWELWDDFKNIKYWADNLAALNNGNTLNRTGENLGRIGGMALTAGFLWLRINSMIKTAEKNAKDGFDGTASKLVDAKRKGLDTQVTRIEERDAAIELERAKAQAKKESGV